MSSYSNSGSMALLKTNSIWCGYREGCRHLASHGAAWQPLDRPRVLRVSSAGHSVRAIVDSCRHRNHVSSRNNFYRLPQQWLTIITPKPDDIEFHSCRSAATSKPLSEFTPSRRGIATAPKNSGFKPLVTAWQKDISAGFKPRLIAPARGQKTT